MAIYNWTSSTSGTWDLATNWGAPTPPTMYDTADIDVPNITVTVTGGTGIAPAAAYILDTQFSTLSIINGTLTTIEKADFQGYFYENGGIYSAQGTGATFADGIDLVSGVLNASAGAYLNISGGGQLAGALTGAGTLILTGGSTYLDKGFSDTQSNLIVGNGSKLGVIVNTTYAGNFVEQANAVVDIFGVTLTLTGTNQFQGVLGDGVLNDRGTMTLGSPTVGNTILDNGLVANIFSTVNQDGFVGFGTGDAGAKLTIYKTGQYLINGNWSVGDPSLTGSLVNLGVFEKTAGARTSLIAPSFTTTNLIKVVDGSLLLEGAVNALSGLISGAGTFGVAAGVTTLGAKLSITSEAFVQDGGVLVLNNALSYANDWDMAGGVLNLNSTHSTLSLTRLDLAGGVITGYGGTLLVDNADFSNVGTNITFGGPTTLTITGVLDQTGTIGFGGDSNPVANIEAGATWELEANSNIVGVFGQINNAGTFIDPNGSGISIIGTEFISTGTVTVNDTGLSLDGPFTSLSGTVNGTGLLDLAGGTDLGPGLTLAVNALEVDGSNVVLGSTLGYAGHFSEIGSSAVLNLQNFDLNLTGATSLDAGTITGGMLTSSGLTTIGAIELTSTTLAVTTNADQAGALVLNGGELFIEGGATYKIDDDYSIGATVTLGTVVNAGTLISNGTAASDYIADTYNQTGTLFVANSALQLTAGGSLAGLIEGPHGSLQLTGGTFALAAGLSLTIAEIALFNQAGLSLNANETYNGYFYDLGTGNGTALTPNGNTLSLTGTTQLIGSTISGGGEVLTTNTATLSSDIVSMNTTLALGGVTDLAQSGTLALAGGALVVNNKSSFTIEAKTEIFGTGTLTVAAGGSVSAVGDGIATLTTAIANAGMISAGLGTLVVAGSVTGAGDFAISGTGTLLFSNTATVTASTPITFLAAGADLVLENTPTFGGELVGFSAGDMIELPGFESSAKGTLSSNGLTFTVTDSNGADIALKFTTAQSVSSIYTGISATDGNVVVLHH